MKKITILLSIISIFFSCISNNNPTEKETINIHPKKSITYGVEVMDGIIISYDGYEIFENDSVNDYK